MTDSPRSWSEALTYAQDQAARPSFDWTGYCQMFVRSCYGIPALFGSAWAQWLGADGEDKHVGGSPADAPVGSALCFKGTGPYGHIDLAARPFDNGAPAAWSNDLVTYGDIDKVFRSAPTSNWGQPYLGYLTAVNDYDLQLRANKPPKPKQTQRYHAVDKALNRIGHALETAKAQHDAHDVRVLEREVERLTRMYENLRRS